MPREEKALFDKIFRSNPLLLGQRRILAHQDTPGVDDGKAQGFVVADLNRFDQNGEIEKALVHLLDDIDVIPGIDLDPDGGMLFEKPTIRLEDGREGLGFTAADQKRSRQAFLLGEGLDLLIGPIEELDDFQGPSPQQNARIGQTELVASFEKRLADFQLESLELAGEVGLGRMTKLACLGDAQRIGDGQKVFQGTDIHIDSLRIQYNRKSGSSVLDTGSLSTSSSQFPPHLLSIKRMGRNDSVC